LKTLGFVWTQKYCPSGNIWGAVVFLLFFHIKDLLSSVFFRKFAREKYKYNKEVKVEVKMEVKWKLSAKRWTIPQGQNCRPI